MIDKLFVTFKEYKENNPEVGEVIQHNLQLLKEKTGVRLTGFYRLNRKEIVKAQKWLRENGYYAFELDKFVIKPMTLSNSISRHGYKVFSKAGKLISRANSLNYYVIAVDEVGNPYSIFYIYI